MEYFLQYLSLLQTICSGITYLNAKFVEFAPNVLDYDQSHQHSCKFFDIAQVTNFIIDVSYESGDIINYYITNCPRNIQDDLLQRINIFAIAIMTLINRVNMDYIFLAGDAKISLMEFALNYSKKTHVDWNTTLIQILRIIVTQDERKVVF